MPLNRRTFLELLAGFAGGIGLDLSRLAFPARRPGDVAADAPVTVTQVETADGTPVMQWHPMPRGGTFKVTCGGRSTEPINFNASLDEVTAALAPLECVEVAKLSDGTFLLAVRGG